mgnify:CR=1 FL=1
MILMNLRADNLYLFNDFVLDMSYPKKLVKTGIADEYLEGCPNFRYKKVAIIMGANATGKTRLGKLLCNIFLFIKRREYSYIVKSIEDRSKEAYFSIDFAFFTSLKRKYPLLMLTSSTKADVESCPFTSKLFRYFHY